MATLLVAWVLNHWLGAVFMTVPTAGVLATGLVAGPRIGLVSVPVYALAFDHFFFRPIGLLPTANPMDEFRIPVFCVVAALVAVVSGWVHDRRREMQAEAAERARLTARVEQSERQFRMLAENAPDAVYRHVLFPEHRVEYVNPSWERLTGYAAEDHYADPDLCRKLVLPEDQPKLHDLFSGAAHAADAPLVLRWRRRDGKVIWTEQRNNIIRDDTGRAVAVEGIIREVTARIEAQQARDLLLEENRRRSAEMKAILDSMTAGIAIYDAEGRLFMMNQTAQRLVPLTDADRQRLDRERIPLMVLKGRWLDGSPVMPEEIGVVRALRGERSEPVVVQVQREEPDAPPRILSVNSAPIFDDAGKILGAVTALTDITRIHELQEQREDLLHAVSHDVRTPLQSILMNAAVIERGTGGPERTRVAIQSIRENARRMNAAIQDVLEMARLTAKEMHPRPEDVPLRGFINEMTRRLFLDRDLSRLHVEVPGDTHVYADPQHIERILTNLLTNALKYSPSDAPVVVRAERDADKVAISVLDRGPGVSVDDQAKVFSRYFKGRSARKEGIGLGLYVAKVLAEAQGGSISLFSTVGAGSEFRVLLPKSPPE